MGGYNHPGAMAALCRVEIARGILERARGTPTYNTESAEQAAILTHHLGEQHLHDADVVDISVKIAQLPWACPRDCETVMATLRGAVGKVSDRWNPQDYTMFMRYLPASQWLLQRSGELDDYGCCSKLFQFLKGLGLKYPSEPTFAAMTGFRSHVESKL